MTVADRRSAAALTLLETGWKIVAFSCGCGGRFAWSFPNPGGAMGMYGCICHNDPIEIVKARCAFMYIGKPE